jgi:hypothetical protein
MTLPYSPRLERMIGQQQVDQRQEDFERLTNSCPPIDPHLIRHLEKVFAPATHIKPDHAELGQLLFIQYGIDRLIHYLKSRYDQQSLAARKANQ